MSNLTIRTENQNINKPAPFVAPAMEWPAMRMMRDLLGWDPFREMEPFFVAPETAFVPMFEVCEDKDSYLFKADLPGIKESDLNISLTGNRLLITGKRESKEEQKGTTYYVCERSYGEFNRAFTLPSGADTEHVKADLSNGVLSLVVPKLPGAQTKQIPLRGEAAKAKA